MSPADPYAGHRSAVALTHPPDDVSDLPIAALDPDLAWFRQHRLVTDNADNGCWWHSSLATDPNEEPCGRFDLADPEGTCYLASSEGAAAREGVGRFLAWHLPIPPEAYSGRVVSQVRLPGMDGPAADLLSPEAAPIGITAEIHSTPDYRLTTEWAAAARRDGFGALRYQARFGQEPALALFGPAGAHPDRGVISSRPLSDVLADLNYRLSRSALPSTPTTAERVDDDAEPEDAEPDNSAAET